jgi:hypothetical protein
MVHAWTGPQISSHVVLMYSLYVSDEENINWLMADKCSCYIHLTALSDYIVMYYIVHVLHRMIQCVIYTWSV